MRTVGLRQLGGALGVHMGEIEAQLTWGLEHLVSLLEDDADAVSDTVARVTRAA